MLRDSSHYPYQNVFVPDELAGRWRSSCSAGGIVGWYFSSATAPLEKLVSIQDSEGYGSDAHNPELLMAIAAARPFETNPERRRRLSARADQLAQIGRAPGRESGCKYVMISVVDGDIKNNNQSRNTQCITQDQTNTRKIKN